MAKKKAVKKAVSKKLKITQKNTGNIKTKKKLKTKKQRQSASRKQKTKKDIAVSRTTKIPEIHRPVQNETLPKIEEATFRRILLTDKKKESLHKLLLQKRKYLLQEVKQEISKYIKGETRQLVDTALDDGDWSFVDLSEDVRLRQLGTHRETLLKIDESLRKLTEGTYGMCESCGQEISKERLIVMPFAIYCRDCQEKIEQLEAIEKNLLI